MKSRLSKYVFMLYADVDKQVYGFTGAFRPILIKIKKKIKLAPGWYLIRKRPANKSVVVTRYDDLIYLDYNNVDRYRKLLLIRYSKVVNSGRKKVGCLRVIRLKDMWYYARFDKVLILLLGLRFMFLLPSQREFLALLGNPHRRRSKVPRGAKCIVSASERHKVTLFVVDVRRNPIPFRDLFMCSYDRFIGGMMVLTVLKQGVLMDVLFGTIDPEKIDDSIAYNIIMSLLRDLKNAPS